MKVVNMGNIADAFRFDNLPATGIVIEATPEELELLPNLVYKDVTISEHVGNGAAKMREALVKADAALSRISQSAWFVDANFSETKEVIDAGNAIEEALSAPPRNCDVGTADEQHARFYSFCDKIEECKKCPLWRRGGLTSKCSVYWGQMPYEEGGAK